MEDRLASLLNYFTLSARVFHTGNLCKQAGFQAEEGVGYVHVLKVGEMDVHTQTVGHMRVAAPALIFYPKPATHHLNPIDAAGCDLVCGAIDFGANGENPLTQAVPCPMVIPLQGQSQLILTLDLLFAEAFTVNCGRQAAMNRLCELLVIQLLRHLMETGEIAFGPLAGLADRRLAKALNAMHNEPGNNWTLDSLAAQAGMSRARFAVNFRDTVGMTPGDYLTQWRLGLAQSLLRKGKPVNLVAHEVGYSGPAALSRVFNARFGLSPTAWARSLQAS